MTMYPTPRSVRIQPNRGRRRRVGWIGGVPPGRRVGQRRRRGGFLGPPETEDRGIERDRFFGPPDTRDDRPYGGIPRPGSENRGIRPLPIPVRGVPNYQTGGGRPGGGGITPGPPQGSGSQVGTGTGGLPLDPAFEAGRRALEDELAAYLAGIAPQRDALLAQGNLAEARLGTNEGLDRRRMMDMLAERGAVGGGVQRFDEGNLATDYARQRQDLASQLAQGLAGFAGQEGEARGGYQRGLMELLLASAANAANSPYTPTPRPGGGRRRNRGGGGGRPRPNPRRRRRR
jgi:hypothetical protein